MVVRLGINGFGRIGRVIFRTCFQNRDFEVVAINDPAIDIEYICYLIKFDSTHGKFRDIVLFTGNEINIDGKTIKVFHEKLPTDIPWYSVGTQYVVEASGMFTNLEKASGHLKSAGVKRVIVTAPSVDVPMLIVGVNEDMISIEQKVISCASSTLYCLAPIIKILEDNYGVAEGFITSIHAMTPSLKPLDGLCLRGKHWRDHRSIHQNIIPAATGACKALNKIIPQVKDKMSGLAFRVPIVNVSVLDITLRLKRQTSLEDIIRNVKKQSGSTMKNIITISNEESVSSDYLGENHSCVLDSTSSLQLTPNFFKLICWYENEHSYACRVIDIILFSERQYNFPPSSRLTHIQSTSSRGTTTDSIKSMFVPRHYSFEMYPNMVYSASQDTGFKMKLPLRPSLSKNTAIHRNCSTNGTTLNRVINKTNEIYKVWNDVEKDDSPTRRNTSAFFQSCMAFGPSSSERNKNVKNKEHLQKVKEDFSKMVNLTENLLSKSSSSRNKVEVKEPIPEQIFIDECFKEPICTENKIKEKKSEKLNIKLGNIPMAGDFSKVESIKNIFETNYPVPESCHDKDIINILKPVTTGDFFENTSFDTILPQSPQSQSVCNSNDVSCTVVEEKEEAKSLNISKVITSDIKPIKSRIFEKEDSTKRTSNTTIGQYLTELTATTHNVLKLIENSGVLDKKRTTNDEEINYSEESKEFEVDKSSPTVEQTLSDTFKISNQNNSERIIPISIPFETWKQEKGDYTAFNNVQSKQRTLETVLRKYTMSKPDPKSEEELKFDDDHIKMINKEDIFDKLDSASGTDSEHSFELNEKKSQIINITDLTNSIEDLAKLDKICRIIEISDELSDKLFSALNDSNSGDIKKKTWSFKDLCERLKLDEFCNKVFGQ